MTATPPTAPSILADTLDVVDAVLDSIDRRLPIHVSRDDLASAGKLALIEALLRFNGPSSEARAYCYVRVRGAVFDELRRLDPLSRHARTQINLVRRATNALERQLGRLPTAGETAAATGLSPAALSQLERLAVAATPASVDDPEEDHLQTVPDPDAACPARSLESLDTHAAVRAALERLAPIHALVLRRYYLEDATLEEIALELGVSKERVRQVREAAEKKLREDFIVLALWQSFLTHR